MRLKNEVMAFWYDENGVTVIEIVLLLVDIPTKKERQRYSV